MCVCVCVCVCVYVCLSAHAIHGHELSGCVLADAYNLMLIFASYYYSLTFNICLLYRQLIFHAKVFSIKIFGVKFRRGFAL